MTVSAMTHQPPLDPPDPVDPPSAKYHDNELGPMALTFIRACPDRLTDFEYWIETHDLMIRAQLRDDQLDRIGAGLVASGDAGRRCVAAIDDVFAELDRRQAARSAP
jgi:hypothetical protein